MEKTESLEVNPSALLAWHEKVRSTSFHPILQARPSFERPRADDAIGFTVDRGRRCGIYRQGHDRPTNDLDMIYPAPPFHLRSGHNAAQGRRGRTVIYDAALSSHAPIREECLLVS